MWYLCIVKIKLPRAGVKFPTRGRKIQCKNLKITIHYSLFTKNYGTES